MPTSRSRGRSSHSTVASLVDRLAKYPDLDLPRALLEDEGVLHELGIAAVEPAHATLAPDFPIHVGFPPGALTVFRKGESTPRFVITKASVHQPNRISLNVEIAAGTIWIAARSLHASWPDDAYVGFTVEKGTLAFTRSGNVFHAEHKDGRITYEDEVDFVLDAKPATIEPAGNLCPAKPSVNGPDNVHIEWKNAQPAAFKIGAASATFAGQTIVVSETASKPSLESDLAAIVFAAALKPATWDAAQLESDLVSFSGTTKLHGGWALPIVEPPPNGVPGDAPGPGFFLFRCANTLHASWGGGEGDLYLPSAAISVSEGKLILLQQTSAAEPLTRTLRTWAVRKEENAPRLPLTLRFGGPKQSLAYLCDAATGELLLASCGASVAIDRPVTIHGRPLELAKSEEAWLAVEKKKGKTRVRVVALDRIAYRRPGVLLALRNAIVPSSQPLVVSLDGTLSEGGLVDEGTLSLTLVASGWLPTLPDPYVGSSLLPKISHAPETAPFPRGEPTLLGATVTWTAPPLPVVSFDGTVSAALGVGSPQTKDPSRPLQQDPDTIRVPTQTAQGAELPQGFKLKPKDVLADRAATNPAPHGLRLLDVSTNKDLLGVEAAREQTQFPVRALDVCTPASSLRVFALPQVQWEPVRTLDRDQDVDLGHFPTPLASVTDGGATLLGVTSRQLVPAIPDLAVDVFLDEFEAGRRAVLATTLPFGLKAVLELRPTDTQAPVKRKRDSIRRNEPEFAQPAMRGGAQLSFVAESGPSGRRQSSHFDGGAWQTLNGVTLATGAPLHLSVLGAAEAGEDSIEELFNDEFSPGLPTARVPVTRLDVSGYGGSCFSEWVNQDAAFADAARVQFNVLVGRTALEIVKFATVLYPWGVRLTRSVTIERKGGGGVIRRDTGWLPASDGLFQFPGDTKYQVQPGLLRGLFSIRNVRSTGHEAIRFAGTNGREVVLTPKFFDARVKIDGLEGPDDLAGNGILGFLQVLPKGDALDENELAMLLEQQGPAGGPVDGVVNVGGSGFCVRATRIEVGVGKDGQKPELVGVVRSAPMFKQDGSWSAVRGPGPSNKHPDSELVNVSDQQGLPVVRAGKLLGVTGTTMNLGPQSVIRFCDASDLHRSTDPEFEYAILQTSPAHTFLFPRPHIEAGTLEVRSLSVPRFADTIARSTSKGLFPPFANAIALPPNTLLVKPGGGFKLMGAVNLKEPRGPLVLTQTGSDVMQIDYEHATLTFNVEPDSWHVNLGPVEVWNDILGIQKVLGSRMHVTGGTTQRPQLHGIESLLAGSLGDALSVLRGFGDRPPSKPIDLTATNAGGEIAIGYDFAVDVEGGPVEFGFAMSYAIGWAHDREAEPGQKDALVYDASLGAYFEAFFQPNIFFVVIGASVELAATAALTPVGEDSASVDVRVYIGVGIKTGLFEGKAAVGLHIVIDGVVKCGVILMVELEIDLKVIVFGFSGEIGCLMYKDDSDPPHTKACEGHGEIEVHVEFFFITLSASREYRKITYH